MTVALPREEALASPRRAAIHAAIAGTPGIHFRALARQVGVPAGTLRHHLNVLVRSGVLREERVGTTSLAFLPADDTRDAAVLAVLLEPGMAALRDLVASAGRVCQRDLVAYLDGIWPRSTVQHRLARLVEAGVLRLTPQGRLLFYEVAA